MLENFETYVNEPPPGPYAPLTYAYDLMTEEKALLVRECKRLDAKGVTLCLRVWDTRGTGARTWVREDLETRKESVFAEIFTRGDG